MRKAKREKINRLMKKQNFTFEKGFYYLKIYCNDESQIQKSYRKIH